MVRDVQHCRFSSPRKGSQTMECEWPVKVEKDKEIGFSLKTSERDVDTVLTTL